MMIGVSDPADTIAWDGWDTSSCSSCMSKAHLYEALIQMRYFHPQKESSQNDLT